MKRINRWNPREGGMIRDDDGDYVPWHVVAAKDEELARLREAASREVSYIEGIRQLCLEDRGRARSALRRMGARLRAAVEGGE